MSGRVFRRRSEGFLSSGATFHGGNAVANAAGESPASSRLRRGLVLALGAALAACDVRSHVELGGPPEDERRCKRVSGNGEWVTVYHCADDGVACFETVRAISCVSITEAATELPAAPVR